MQKQNEKVKLEDHIKTQSLALVEASKARDFDKMDALLNDGILNNADNFDVIISVCKKHNLMGVVKYMVESMPNKEIYLNKAIKACAKYGLEDFVDRLINKGADINCAVEGAILGDRYRYVKKLVDRGADRRRANEFFTQNQIYLKPEEYTTRSNFSRGYDPDEIDWSPNDLNGYNFPDFVVDRVHLISSHMEKGESYNAAYARTDKATQKQFFLFVVMLMNKEDNQASWSGLPRDVLIHVLSFMPIVPLNDDEVKGLLFNMQRACFNVQLSTYTSSVFFGHKNRAESFQIALKETKTSDEIKSLVQAQVQVLQGNNPYKNKDAYYKQDVKNKAPTDYHAIIGLWSKTFTGEKVVFDEIKEESMMSKAFSLVSNSISK